MCTAIHSSHYPPLRHYFRCRPRCYIRLVQHLIEKCLTFDMDRDAVVAALAKYASIEPVVTITVWNELLKENPAFFSSYFEAQQRRLRNTQLIQHALSSKYWLR